MNELNKKMIEFAGFCNHEFGDGDKMVAKCIKCGEFCGYIWSGDEEQDAKIHPPDFTKDETACFKWLVPKLRDLSLNYPSIVHDKPTYLASTWRDGVSYLGYDENPAKAICLAIEKLIDGEKK